MGSVQFGIPRELTLALKARYGISCLVETGTDDGNSTLWASEHFKEVWTIELKPEKFREAKERLSMWDNIKCVCGDSAPWLKTMRPNRPILYWLDAHTNESCPVLSEIAAINRSLLAHVILVDDARLFGGGTEALPNWPTKQAVIGALAFRNRVVSEFGDVLIAEPCP